MTFSEGDWHVWKAKIMGVFYELGQNINKIEGRTSILIRILHGPSQRNEEILMRI